MDATTATRSFAHDTMRAADDFGPTKSDVSPPSSLVHPSDASALPNQWQRLDRVVARSRSAASATTIDSGIGPPPTLTPIAPPQPPSAYDEFLASRASLLHASKLPSRVSLIPPIPGVPVEPFMAPPPITASALRQQGTIVREEQ